MANTLIGQLRAFHTDRIRLRRSDLKTNILVRRVAGKVILPVAPVYCIFDKKATAYTAGSFRIAYREGNNYFRVTNDVALNGLTVSQKNLLVFGVYAGINAVDVFGHDLYIHFNAAAANGNDDDILDIYLSYILV